MTEGKEDKGSKHRRENDIVNQRMVEEMERKEMESTVLKVTEFVSVNELATLMNACGQGH